MTNVLAVVAHPDDEVLGPGATLARHAALGDETHVLILAEGKTSRGPLAEGAADVSNEETAKACARLGVTTVRRLDLDDNRLDRYPLLELARHVTAVVEECGPEVVYTHHPGDLNIDHELTARAAMIACRPHASPVRWLLSFSTLSATDAGHAGRPPFTPSVYADVTSTLQAKIDAMACYASELREHPHPRSLHAIRLQAELLGAHAGMPAAEAFAVLRGTWPSTPLSRWSGDVE
ncbi:MAG TPA: PIG-L deacetylase family protein [Streptomyces sp.]|uniref:PIG-L deacetylase family protein n=1 Tax=Streptomyces sp. TaxID=1931 RepID=UPI002D6D3D89|nr:PIG-L deacetylase family protein [Streptomyces sp.]HZG04666.1 PIG-L deacetylase family protein [Streptomyces sp.]